MSRTQHEKQQSFRQKLQEEGADSFADGPRPWEQWDESGSQHDNRIWEGTARRIHPKRKGARGFGERLLSGLAVVALASMVVGIAGVYFSTPVPRPTPQQARTLIQPPPIVTRRMSTPPATPLAEPAETTTPVLARLDTLSPPAAGSTVVPDERKTVLEPAVTDPWTDPVVKSGNLDKVAVETVITEETVTTTVYTRQLSQDEPEVVAMVATTTPPFTHGAAQHDEAPVTATRENARTVQTDVPAAAPIARTGDKTVTAPSAAGQTEHPASEAAVIAQAGTLNMEPVVVEQATGAVTEPIIVAQAGTEDPEAAASEQAAGAVTEPAAVAQAGTEDPEAAASEQAAGAVTEPIIVAQAGTEDREAAASEQAAGAVTEPAAVAQAGTEDPEAAASEQATGAVTEPAAVAQAGTEDREAAASERAAAPGGSMDTGPAVAGDTARPATEAAPVTADSTAGAEAAPDIIPEAETAADTPVPPKAKTGKWVINLSSYTRKRTAERMLAVFKQKGVDAEVFSTTINDKPIHRIRVTGFETARSARAGISALEQKLDLDGAWISKH